MATTTNYSWSTPDDTALVKDGAAAIRTLGSSADTTVKALNPGTTAGDIDYYTTSTAKARVGIGTAGQVLQVNSGATAPEWATPTSGGMTLLSTTTLSGVTVTISSIDQTYNSLYILVEEPTWTTGSSNPRFSIDGSIAFQRIQIFQQGAFIANDGASATFNMQRDNTATNAANMVGVVTINNYASTTARKVFNYLGGAPTSDNNFVGYFGLIQTESAISQIRFTNSNGYAFDGGTVRIYGVK